MDSSYNVWINVSGIVCGINIHSMHKGEVLVFLLCAFRKAIKNFEVKLNVQKEGKWFGEKVDNKCVSFIQIMFHSLLSYGNSPGLLVCEHVSLWDCEFVNLWAFNFFPFMVCRSVGGL